MKKMKSKPASDREPVRCFTGLTSLAPSPGRFFFHKTHLPELNSIASQDMPSTGTPASFRASPSDGLVNLYQSLEPVRARYPKLRWLPPSDLHITLRFFGNIHGELLSRAGQALLALQSCKCLTLTFDSYVLLPSARKPRVLALTCTNRNQNETIQFLKKQYSTHTGGTDSTNEHFLPHLTIARFAPNNLPGTHLSLPLPLELEVNAVALYQAPQPGPLPKEAAPQPKYQPLGIVYLKRT